MTDLEPSQPDHHEISAFTGEIVGAYVAHHTVAANDLPDLIQAVSKDQFRPGRAEDRPLSH